MKTKNNYLMMLGGGGIGLINGFFGGGGGMLCVPLLTKLGAETKCAHATAMLIILPISVASAITYIAGGHFDLWLTLAVGGGAIVGGIVGAVLLKRLKSDAIAVIFAVLMVVAGLRMALR